MFMSNGLLLKIWKKIIHLRTGYSLTLCLNTQSPASGTVGEVVGPLGSVAWLAEVSHWGQALKVMSASRACPSFLLPCSPVWEALPPYAPFIPDGTISAATLPPTSVD